MDNDMMNSYEPYEEEGGKKKKKKKKKKEKEVIIYDEETVKAQEGKGTAAMILGIIGVCLFLGPISLVCGIVATFLGCDSFKKSNGTYGKAGKIMGIISNCIWGTALLLAILTPIILGIIWIIAGLLLPFVMHFVGLIFSLFG